MATPDVCPAHGRRCHFQMCLDLHGDFMSGKGKQAGIDPICLACKRAGKCPIDHMRKTKTPTKLTPAIEERIQPVIVPKGIAESFGLSAEDMADIERRTGPVGTKITKRGSGDKVTQRGSVSDPDALQIDDSGYADAINANTGATKRAGERKQGQTTQNTPKKKRVSTGSKTPAGGMSLLERARAMQESKK